MEIYYGKELWPVHDDMPRVRFKGGSSTQTTVQTRDIPARTQQEAELENALYYYGADALHNSNRLLGSITNSINGINSGDLIAGSNNLINGVLPAPFATARQQALNSDLAGTMGSAINNLGNRGILNSSVTRSALNDISRNASDTLARNYSSDLGTYAGLLGNAYSVPSQLVNLANASQGPAANLYSTMFGGRMGVSTGGTTTETAPRDNSGTWGAIGSLGSALIMCFASGTKIATPDGDKLIEDIKVGDEVCSLDDENKLCVETVEYVNPAHICDVLEVVTDKGTIKPTNSQRFLTAGGFEYIEEINKPIITLCGQVNVKSIKQLPPELVYDFTVSGRNLFFANGLAAEGWD